MNFYTQHMFTQSKLLHTEAFTQNKLLDRETFTHSKLLHSTLLHVLHRDLMHRQNFYTKRTSEQKSFYTKPALTQGSSGTGNFYTKPALTQRALTQRSSCTGKLLHKANFYTLQPFVRCFLEILKVEDVKTKLSCDNSFKFQRLKIATRSRKKRISTPKQKKVDFEAPFKKES